MLEATKVFYPPDHSWPLTFEVTDAGCRAYRAYCAAFTREIRDWDDLQEPDKQRWEYVARSILPSI